MSGKNALKVIRLDKEESAKIDRFLELNTVFQNFSALARVALLDFITRKGSIELRPIVNRSEAELKKGFLWDYDLSDAEIREILSGPQKNRLWLVARILEHAKFEEVWDYLSIDDIRRDLPKLRMRPKLKKHWEYAIKRWGK